MAKLDDNFNLENIDDDLTNLLNQINEVDPLFESSDSIHSENDNESSDFNPSPTDVGDVFSDALSAVSSLTDNEDISIDDSKIVDTIEDDVVVIEDIEEETKKKKRIKRVKKKKEKTKKLKADKAEKTEKEKKAKNVKSERVKKEKPKKVKAEKVKKEKVKREKIKKEKPKKEKSSLFLIDEIEDKESTINVYSTITVFFIFFIVIVLLFVSTNLYSYSISIKRANKHFVLKEYNEAFDEIYGLKIKDEDIEIYDKIVTVMYVNKQLNSYNNFYAAKMYNESLDSLLKGLIRYEKYIDLAILLGVDEDLEYVREQILAELKNVFDINEDQANSLMMLQGKSEYNYEIDKIVSNK